MIQSKMYSILFLLMLFLSCTKSDKCDNDALKTNSFVQETNYCLDDNLSFEIAKLQDSRCPLTVVCVWAGKVDVSLLFSGSSSLDTTIAYELNKETTFNLEGYQFAIDSITPYPVSPTDTEPLTVHMKVTKK